MKKTLAIISLIITIIVAINELSWINRTDLAWPLIGLSVAIGLIAISQIINNKE
jgi:hypothetical protein